MSNTERPSRRAALLGDRPGSYAIARHIRMSASKCRRVVNLVRGMDAVEAVTMLKFQPQAAAEPVRKVIASAMANAEQTEGLRADELYVSQAFVDEGMTMRRIRPRAKGSADRILKRSAHITVVVEPKDARPASKKAKKKGRPAAAAKSETEKGA
ncbi:50S ribosomal protein L22 [Cutibacterium sp.]|uniref:50S ribosomal protein L22 n=1 Tax=Cutibacterium sp. TaxID=1912221 RepID=UPI0026DBE06F|nr:50S ribosomal protein L22 [Cutibacterium sp.]MDO4413397.1 50S ribosomal protein L22 [Cutibacterium sp.]